MTRRGEDDLDLRWAQDAAIELEPDDAGDSLDARETRPGPTSARWRRPPARFPAVAWVGAALGLIVAGVLTVAPIPPERGAQAILPDLRDPPTLAWRLPAGSARSDQQVWAFEDVLVLNDARGLSGLDGATGRELWAVEEPDARCNATPAEVVCVVPGSDRVLVVEPRTGTVSPHRRSGVIAATLASGDLLELRQTVEGFEVARVHGGLERWVAPVERVLFPAPDPSVRMVVFGSSLFLDLSSGLALNIATGEPSHRFSSVDTFPGERWIVRSALDEVYEHFSADGVRTPLRTAYALVPYIDDAPEADTWFVMNPGDTAVRAVSDRTGETLWRIAEGEYPLARLGSHVMGLGEYALVGRDATTGAEQWRLAPESGLFGWPFYADGRYLSVAEVTADGLVGLRCVDTRTGEATWRVPVSGTPSAPLDDASHGSYLYVLTQREVIAFHFG